MTQPVQAMQASAAPENWKSSLKLPPKDQRFRTEVCGPPDPIPAFLGWEISDRVMPALQRQSTNLG